MTMTLGATYRGRRFLSNLTSLGFLKKTSKFCILSLSVLRSPFVKLKYI